jgi:hypothetical protein
MAFAKRRELTEVAKVLEDWQATSGELLPVSRTLGLGKL